MNHLIKNRFGFTLLEIMVVVAIMGVLTTLAVTSMRTVSLRHQKNAAASEIFGLLHQARSMARSSSLPATITVNNVATPPGGSIVAAIGAPVNWAQTLAFGPGSNYSAVGLVGVVIGPYTLSPVGTVTPTAFSLKLRDRDFAMNGEEVMIAVSLLGDVTITP